MMPLNPPMTRRSEGKKGTMEVMDWMIMKKIFVYIILIGILPSSILTGCSGKDGRFSVGFRNMGKDNICVINQQIGNQSVVAGILLYKKVKSSTIFIEGFDFPETVSVKWEKADSRSTQQFH